MLLALAALALAQDPPASPPPAAGAPEEPPPLVEMPVLQGFVEAPYPEEARALGLDAKVLLAIEIDATGAVTNVEVLQPAGHGFDEAAVTAARQFRFSPAKDATGPVPVVVEFEYGFVHQAAPAPEEVPAAEAPVTLEGTLREMGTRLPLDGFVVRVEPVGVETTTDAEGRYALRGLPPGAYTVRVVRPGYDALEQPVEVVAGEVTTAKLWIRNQSYRDEGIVGTYRPETADVTRRTISMEEVRRIPGTFGDPVRVIQNLPGAARSPFGSGLLIIRGSSPQDSGVYVDGIRIPYIYHLGGLESVVNPDLVSAVDYLPGGFGPRYGRSTGGVVDVRTREEMPERTRVVWSTDILDSGFLVMGSAGEKDQHGFGFAARRSYVDAILPYFLEEGFSVRPRWYDYQAKYVWQGDGPIEFSALVFGFQDVLFASTGDDFAQGSDPDGQGDVATDYSTHRVLATLEAPLDEHWTLRILPSFGNDYANFTFGSDWRVMQSQWIAEVRAEAVWEPSEHLKVVPGIDFIGGWADFEVQLPFNPESFASTDPLAEREPWAFGASQTGWGPDLYLQAEWRPLADRDALLVSPGVRFDYVSIPDEYDSSALDPRLSARWRLAPKSHLKGSVGLYHQPPQPFQTYRQDDQVVELLFERSLSASLGWEQEVGAAIRGELELFWKGMDQLIVSNPSFTTLDDQFFSNDGVGRAYGMELIVRHEPVGRFFGWLSYTLSRSERRDHPGEEWYFFDFDQTHILTAVAGYSLPYEIELGAKGQYVTGNPTSPYAGAVYDLDQDSYQGFRSGDYNTERLPPYWAVSLRIDKLFTFRSWQLDVYLDLLNVLRGVNPEFEVYNYDYTEKAYIRGLPFIPSPGFEAKFEF